MKDENMLNLEETLTNKFLEEATDCYFNFKERLFGLLEAYASIRASIQNADDSKYNSIELELIKRSIVVLVADTVIRGISDRLGQDNGCEDASNKNFKQVYFNLIDEFESESLHIKYQDEK